MGGGGERWCLSYWGCRGSFYMFTCIQLCILVASQLAIRIVHEGDKEDDKQFMGLIQPFIMDVLIF